MQSMAEHQIAVTGYGGQLGTEICRQLGKRAIPLSEAELDLTDEPAVRRVLKRLDPVAVINTAAYTQVDRAEADRQACFQINAQAVQTLAEICRDLDCPLMQVSTDYVFGADRGREFPYREDDAPAPINVYGHSKLAGETAASGWAKHFIIRTCGLYCLAANGPLRGRNFVDTMLTLAEQRNQLQIVHDQYCTPTYVPHLAAAMIRLLETADYGTWHVTNQGKTSWLEFAQELFRQAGITMRLDPITTEQYGAAAPRPKYSVLDTSKLGRSAAGLLPSWQQGLTAYLLAFENQKQSQTGGDPCE
jgi:dTDP-4-dehydrorhamnose reductase